MNWQRVDNCTHYWTCKQSGINYYLEKVGRYWWWSAYAVMWSADSVPGESYREAKRAVEAFAKRWEGEG